MDGLINIFENGRENIICRVQPQFYLHAKTFLPLLSYQNIVIFISQTKENNVEEYDNLI